MFMFRNKLSLLVGVLLFLGICTTIAIEEFEVTRSQYDQQGRKVEEKVPVLPVTIENFEKIFNQTNIPCIENTQVRFLKNINKDKFEASSKESATHAFIYLNQIFNFGILQISPTVSQIKNSPILVWAHRFNSLNSEKKLPAGYYFVITKINKKRGLRGIFRDALHGIFFVEKKGKEALKLVDNKGKINEENVKELPAEKNSDPTAFTSKKSSFSLRLIPGFIKKSQPCEDIGRFFNYMWSNWKGKTALLLGGLIWITGTLDGSSFLEKLPFKWTQILSKHGMYTDLSFSASPFAIFIMYQILKYLGRGVSRIYDDITTVSRYKKLLKCYSKETDAVPKFKFKANTLPLERLLLCWDTMKKQGKRVKEAFCKELEATPSIETKNKLMFSYEKYEREHQKIIKEEVMKKIREEFERIGGTFPTIT